jgi:serine/threonine protein kinase
MWLVFTPRAYRGPQEIAMIVFACPKCHQRLKVRDGLGGKCATCPHCKQNVPIPEPGTTDEMTGSSPTPPADASRDTLTVDQQHTGCGLAHPAQPAELVASIEGMSTHQGSSFHTPPITHTPSMSYPGLSAPEVSSILAPPRGPEEMGWLGQYRVLKVLGIGGMGMVLLAEDPQLKRQLALKVMKPLLAASSEARRRFQREAQATAAVDHEHIVTIYQVGEERGVPFLAMPLLRGESLAVRLRREGGRLPLPEVLRIGREIAEGLEAAHAVGLIHRDVKPSNIWLEAGHGRVKVLDFGLARGKDDVQLTQTGYVLGTPAYMAPEQADGKAVDRRCDLFSLGCILYFMSSGEAPFQGADMMTTLKKVLFDTLRPLHESIPDTPAALSRLVLQLMAKNPADRPPRAIIVVEALRTLELQTESAASGAEVALPTSSAPPQSPAPFNTDPLDDAETVCARDPQFPMTRRRVPNWIWLLSGAGAIVVLGLLALLVLMNRDRATADPAPAKDTETKQKPTGVDPPEKWLTFSPPGGRFSVLLPGEPRAGTTVTQSGRGELESLTFSIEAGPITYYAAYFDFPGIVPKGPQIKADLRNVLKSYRDKIGRVKIVRNEDTTLDGFAGKLLVLEDEQKRFVYTLRMYLVRNRVYTLMATVPTSQAEPPEVRQFLDSFRLTD